MNARTRGIIRSAIYFVVGAAVYLMVTLPTGLSISYMSPHPWWGTPVTILNSLVGVYFGAVPAVKKLAGWLDRPR